MAAEPRVAVNSQDLLGEGPCWDDREGVLTWVDIKGCRVHSWSPTSREHNIRVVPREVSLALPARAGGAVVAQVDEVFLDDGDELSLLCRIEPDNEHTRLNDGCCDDDGQLWVGTYSTRGEPEAALYRVTPEGQADRAVAGMMASNGVAWSADGAALYLTDTGFGRIDRYVMGGDGALARADSLMTADGDSGRPDGLALDDEGGVWVAMWGGRHLRRYDPRGRLTERVDLPVTYPTSVAFGGESRDTLFVTTSSHHLSDPHTEPLAGSVLALTPGVRGLPTRRFG